ncbi:hypothetical protein [Serratia inhibens]|uniref:hypothetical protein n=1 Tax=Serratia inhibens TaxID=2338073 RepID=UPI003217E5E8
MNVYEMEGFLRGKCLPGDLLVGESNAAYLVRKLNESATLKADRDAQQKRADALAVENAALKESAADLRRQAFNGRRNSHNCGPFKYSDLCESIIESTKVETPATDAALAAIEARGVEKFAAWASEQESMARGAGDKKEARIYCQVEARAKHFAIKLREAK